MPQLTLEPIIIEPHRETRRADPSRGHFLLYDEDFAEETDPRFTTVEPGSQLRVPHFPVSEIAAWVFGRNLHWIRHQFKKTPITLEGELLSFRQIRRSKIHTERRLTLPDIERLAWAFYEWGDIDGVALQRASQVVVAVAQSYLVPDEEN